MKVENSFLHALPEEQSPYSARTMTAVLPLFSLPNNSGPTFTCTLSLHQALRYALPMSADFKSNLFKADPYTVTRCNT